MRFRLFNNLIFVAIFVLSVLSIVSLCSNSGFGRFADGCLAICTVALCVIAGIFVSHEDEEVQQKRKLQKMLRDTERRGRNRRYGTHDFGYNGAIRDIERTLREDF